MPAVPDFPPAPDKVAVRRALISVSDKTGLINAARSLAAAGVELVSTGGTSKAIADAGLPVKDISDLTGFPEMMDGRVKTLHSIVHGGLLGVRDAPEHAKAMADHGIGGIDLVYVNLYPFEQTVAAGADFETCVENIDIGGPAMIRSAAKNHGYVCVCTEIADLEEVLGELQASGTTSLELRKKLLHAETEEMFRRVRAHLADCERAGFERRAQREAGQLRLAHKDAGRGRRDQRARLACGERGGEGGGGQRHAYCLLGASDRVDHAVGEPIDLPG